jgi:CRISPR-associated protein Cas1
LSIWKKISDPFALREAWQKVASNGGSAGGDGVTISRYRARSARNLKQLSVTLRDFTYRPLPCRKVEIPKRKGGVRRLMIPSIQDRILHTAIAKALQPILEPLFEDSSFAYRPGRSVKQAVARIERWRDQGFTHVIEADIVSYFDAIDHSILMGKLTRTKADIVSQRVASMLGEGDSLRVYSIGRNGERRSRVFGDGPPFESDEGYWLF